MPAQQAKVAAATGGATGIFNQAKEVFASFQYRLLDAYVEHPTVVMGVAAASLGLLLALVYMCTAMGGEEAASATLSAKKSDAPVADDDQVFPRLSAEVGDESNFC